MQAVAGQTNYAHFAANIQLVEQINIVNKRYILTQVVVKAIPVLLPLATPEQQAWLRQKANDAGMMYREGSPGLTELRQLLQRLQDAVRRASPYLGTADRIAAVVAEIQRLQGLLREVDARGTGGQGGKSRKSANISRLAALIQSQRDLIQNDVAGFGTDDAAIAAWREIEARARARVNEANELNQLRTAVIAWQVGTQPPPGEVRTLAQRLGMELDAEWLPEQQRQAAAAAAAAEEARRVAEAAEAERQREREAAERERQRLIQEGYEAADQRQREREAAVFPYAQRWNDRAPVRGQQRPVVSGMRAQQMALRGYGGLGIGTGAHQAAPRANHLLYGRARPLFGTVADGARIPGPARAAPRAPAAAVPAPPPAPPAPRAAAVPAPPPAPRVAAVPAAGPIVRNILIGRENDGNRGDQAYSLDLWLRDPDSVIIISNGDVGQPPLLRADLGGYSREALRIMSGERRWIQDVNYHKTMHQAGSNLYISEQDLAVLLNPINRIFFVTYQRKIPRNDIATVIAITREELEEAYEAFAQQGGDRFRSHSQKKTRKQKKHSKKK